MIKQNMIHLYWDTNPKNTSGTGGTYLKAINNVNGVLHYYKMPAYDNYLKECVGYETIFEVVVYRLCKLLGIESLEYNLLDADVIISNNIVSAFITDSEEFKRPGESKITFENFYLLNRIDNEEPILEFCNRMGFKEYIDNMIILDFIICNRDRHGANIEILNMDNTYRPAPLFDNGLSFVAPMGMNIEAILNFDAMSDVPCNNFIGSKSLYKNLELVTSNITLNNLPSDWRKLLSKDIEYTMPTEVWNKIFEMIEKRCDYVYRKNIFN